MCVVSIRRYSCLFSCLLHFAVLFLLLFLLFRFYSRSDLVKLHGIQNYRASAACSSSSNSSDKLTCMSNYCSSNPNIIQCRRTFLLSYFDETTPRCELKAEGLHCCDLCQAAESQAQATAVATAGQCSEDSSVGRGGLSGWISSSHGDPQNMGVDQQGTKHVDLGHEILLFLRAVQGKVYTSHL